MFPLCGYHINVAIGNEKWTTYPILHVKDFWDFSTKSQYEFIFMFASIDC